MRISDCSSDVCSSDLAFDCDGAYSVCARAAGYRSGGDCVRLRCNHHRSVSVGVSVGAVSSTQGGDHADHIAGLARFDSDVDQKSAGQGKGVSVLVLGGAGLLKTKNNINKNNTT